MQEIIRFFVGGFIVSLFAALGDVLKPKSFAGLFGAAPSVALATIGLTIFVEGKAFAAQEARSMIAGALAFFVYASFVIWLIIRHNWHARTASAWALFAWMSFALAVWGAVLR